MSITTADMNTAHTLGTNDRAAFDVVYDAWLTTDSLNGTPDYTDYFKERDAALASILGGERLDDLTATIDQLGDVDDAAQERLEIEVDNLFAAYSGAFGPLPK